MVNIFWTEKAIESYNKITDYLTENWGDQVTSSFVEKTQKTLDILSSNLVKFRFTKIESVYEVPITKHNLLIYRISETQIELLVFYDTRQNPIKKPF